jgi:hypothetical protein
MISRPATFHGQARRSSAGFPAESRPIGVSAVHRRVDDESVTDVLEFAIWRGVGISVPVIGFAAAQSLRMVLLFDSLPLAPSITMVVIFHGAVAELSSAPGFKWYIFKSAGGDSGVMRRLYHPHGSRS